MTERQQYTYALVKTLMEASEMAVNITNGEVTREQVLKFLIEQGNIEIDMPTCAGAEVIKEKLSEEEMER